MVRLELTHTALIVHVEGLDKLWTFTSRLEIPLAHVVDAEPDEAEARKWWHGIKAPGANIPGVITAGTFYEQGERVFWDVHHPEQAIAIRLRDDRYQRLVIEVPDVDAAIQAIRAAVRRG